jgi:hypothetical protein
MVDLTQIRIEADVVRGARAERPQGFSADMRDWSVTLRCMWDGEELGQTVVPFYQGSAHTKPPTASEVFDCVISDAWSAHCADSFEDWAEDFGYDTDSRTAERVYQACERQRAQVVERLLDGSYDLFEKIACLDEDERSALCADVQDSLAALAKADERILGEGGWCLYRRLLSDGRTTVVYGAQMLRGNRTAYFVLNVERGELSRYEAVALAPELAPFLLAHLMYVDGEPMHYIANTIYHVQQGWQSGDAKHFKHAAKSASIGFLESESDLDFEELCREQLRLAEEAAKAPPSDSVSRKLTAEDVVAQIRQMAADALTLWLRGRLLLLQAECAALVERFELRA